LTLCHGGQEKKDEKKWKKNEDKMVCVWGSWTMWTVWTIKSHITFFNVLILRVLEYCSGWQVWLGFQCPKNICDSRFFNILKENDIISCNLKKTNETRYKLSRLFRTLARCINSEIFITNIENRVGFNKKACYVVPITLFFIKFSY
jgi:hypothetical protein